MPKASTVKVTVDLPFFLRLENSVAASYKDVCKEAPLQELSSQSVQISFSSRPSGAIDRSGHGWEHSTVAIEMNLPAPLTEESVGTFAVLNCREILNRVILSYRAITSEVDNADSLNPLGLPICSSSLIFGWTD